MGTEAHVIVRGRDPMPLLERARTRIDELERLWSRFLPDSELSLLNASGGAPRVVSPETFALLRLAVRGWRGDGRAIRSHRARRRARSRVYEILLGTARRARPRGSGRAAARLWWHRVRRRARIVVLPPGVAIDPGGIGKGFAADLVVKNLRAGGANGACVNIGGDLRVFGANRHGHDWNVDVEDPLSGAAPLRRLHVGDGAIATTSRTRRRWDTDAGDRHHLIDPVTGTSADTGIAAVTVVASEGWLAEVLAKAAFLAGAGEAERMLVANHAAGLLVTDDGTVLTLGPIGQYLA